MASDPYRSVWHFEQMRRVMMWTGIIAAPLAGLSMVGIPSVRLFATGALFVVLVVGSGLTAYHMLRR